MLTCKEVAGAIAADELVCASWLRRLSVRFHLLMCTHCRRYARQIRKIGEAVRTLVSSETADSTSREQLRVSILERISTDNRTGQDEPTQDP
jgi:hypothetical protein